MCLCGLLGGVSHWMYVALSFPPSLSLLLIPSSSSLSPLLIPSPLLVFAVLFYHGGCWLEYKLGIQDTARVVPVHGVWYVSPHSVLIPRTHLHEVLGPGNGTRVYPHPYTVVCGALLAQHYSWEVRQQSVTSTVHLRVSATVT